MRIAIKQSKFEFSRCTIINANTEATCKDDVTYREYLISERN